MINGQDAVAHAGKLLVLFKRPGKPVLLSRGGDLIVRPSAIEHSAHRCGQGLGGVAGLSVGTAALACSLQPSH